jgi:hypothetical protein
MSLQCRGTFWGLDAPVRVDGAKALWRGPTEKRTKQAVLAHAFNPDTAEARQEDCETKANLGYIGTPLLTNQGERKTGR